MAMNPLELVGGRIDPHTGKAVDWMPAGTEYTYGGFNPQSFALLQKAGLWAPEYDDALQEVKSATGGVSERSQALQRWRASPQYNKLIGALSGYTQGQTRDGYTLTDYLRDPSGRDFAANSYENLGGLHSEDYMQMAAVLAAGMGGAYAAGDFGALGAAAGSGGATASAMTAEQVAMLAANGLTDAQIAAMATAAGDTAMAASLTGAGMGGGVLSAPVASEAGIKTLGTIAPSAATEAVAPLATTGLESTAPLITATVPQVAGALPATGAAPTPNATPSTSAPGGAMDWSDWAKIGATLISSGVQSNAANNAVNAQAASTQAAIDEQRRQFDLQRADGAPYREAGTNALSQFQTLTNTPTTAADVMQDPGYQFGLDQGQQAIDRKIAAMGGRVSGSAIKAAGRFGTNYATTGYTAADQRRNDRLNRFAALAGIGQSATNASASAGSAMANNISGMVTGQGNAAGGAMLAQGNIWGNTANQLAALYGRGNKQSSVNIPTGPFSNYGGDYNGLGYQP